MFYVLDYKLPGRALVVGTTLYQCMANTHQRCSSFDPANVLVAFYDVNMYNMYILLEVLHCLVNMLSS